MKQSYIICLVNVVLVFIVAALFTTGGGTGYLAYAGLLSLLWAVLCTFIALVFFLFRKRSLGQGFVLTAGVLLLLGFIECSVSPIIH